MYFDIFPTGSALALESAPGPGYILVYWQPDFNSPYGEDSAVMVAKSPDDIKFTTQTGSATLPLTVKLTATPDHALSHRSAKFRATSPSCVRTRRV
jgi:hypothetical protein